jgi:prepilin-type processing-associated H-X9-DG protein/prepilin-type N-terminal cleavage/methylation domain-containing protein
LGGGRGVSTMKKTINAFTLIEILICISIIALLCAVLFPVFYSSKKKSQATACISNLKQTSQSILMYADDYDDTFPDFYVWGRWSALHNNSLPLCPSVAGSMLKTAIYEGFPGTYYRGVPGYAMNAALQYFNATDAGQPDDFSKGRECKRSDVSYLPTTVMLCEQAPDNPIALAADPYSISPPPYPYGIKKHWERHQNGANYAFCDGHVKWYRPESVQPASFDRGPDGKIMGNDGKTPSFMKISTENLSNL